MSLRLEMLQVARIAPKSLGDSAELVRSFLLGQLNSDGGFGDRTGRSDLYYTVFGLESLLALGLEQDGKVKEQAARAGSFLSSWGDGEGLDFVHLCCLARGWSAAGMLAGCKLEEDIRLRLAGRLKAFQAADGGYQGKPGAAYGNAYGAFLALGFFEDLKVPVPESLRRWGDVLLERRLPDGSWANEAPLKEGSTNATAAAVTWLHHLGIRLPRETAVWLLEQQHGQGGFKAMPRAPMPDLLSTATALHALAAWPVDFGGRKEDHLDFVDSLWTGEGGFHGNWTDEDLDCEYTYYGLLALGHLSV